MKLKSLLAGALALGTSSSAMAQTTEITVTGATAFRQATMQAIYNAYDSVGDLGVNFNVAHDFTGNTLSQLIASNRAVFSGSFPGIVGTTVIRTSFNGSTEGLNAIAGNNNPSFLTTGALVNTNVIVGGRTSPTENIRPKFSFSDVYQSTSPITNEVLNPVGESKVGVVTFAMVAGRQATNSAYDRFTNVTFQHCKALWGAGFVPLSLITGNTNDTVRVYATGRNDGSGTRSAYLTEWQYGVANVVKQYVHTFDGITNGAITKMVLVPIGANLTNTNVIFRTGRANDASTLWGNNVVGNGGYSSGSALRGLMTNTSASVQIHNGSSGSFQTARTIIPLTWLSTADAQNAAAAGAKIIAFNGEKVTPLAAGHPDVYQGSGFNQADFFKIARGAYSAWSYQHLYYSGSLTPNEQSWYDAMKTTWIPQGLQITANGLRLEDMQVQRVDDGFPITGL